MVSFFLCKKTFHIFLCPNQLLDLIPCFALVDLFEFEVIVAPKLGVASSHGVGGFQQVVAEITVAGFDHLRIFGFKIAGLAACALMNRQRESGAFVLAVDLPSGINTKKHFPLYLHCK